MGKKMTMTTMRFEGSLAAWNPERGYGSIMPEQGGQLVFVHVSAFPRDGAPPALGEALSFEIVSDSDGRKQAGRVLRSKRMAPSAEARFMAPAPPRGRAVRVAQQRRRRLATGAVALALVAGVVGWLQLSKPQAQDAEQLAQRASGASLRR